MVSTNRSRTVQTLPPLHNVPVVAVTAEDLLPGTWLVFANAVAKVAYTEPDDDGMLTVWLEGAIPYINVPAHAILGAVLPDGALF